VTCQDRRNFLKRASVGAWIGSRLIAGLAAGSGLCGCSYLQQTKFLIPSIPLDKKTQLSNPITVGVNDSEFLWNQIVDTVEDYFRIKSEQRASRDATQWLEGRMETYPEIGATLLDVDRSQYSSEGSAIARHDGTIVRASPGLVGQPITLGWIRQENDTELEQRILREILGRSTNVSPPRRAARTFK